MVPWLLLLLSSWRGWLAGIVSLRWARVGRFDLAVPAAIGVVIWMAAPQLGSEVAGTPFWVAWIVATAAVVVPLSLWSRARRSISAGSGPTPAPAPRPSPAPAFRPSPAPAFRGAHASTLGLTLVVGVVVAWILYDIAFWGQTIRLYDLDVYLGSASRWLDGGQPYMAAPVAAWNTNPRLDFFLYPPPLLPVFGLLSRLPDGPVAVGWVVFLVACAYKSFRILGLPRTWSVALLAFPPVAIGFESGNVASLTFLLYVAAMKAGGTLIVDGFFKVQTGLPALWLIRQRRWRGIAAGMAAIVAIALVTLPLVGLDSWRAWLDGLGYRAASQAAVHALFGYSYAGVLPATVFAVLSVAAIGLALLFRGRPGLAAMGLASIFASPALWPHGFVFALPALLMLESGTAVWLLLGAGAFGPNMWLLFYGGWVAVMAARRYPAGRLHPLAGTDGPWPNRMRPRSTGPWSSPTVKVSATVLSGSAPAATAERTSAAAQGDYASGNDS